MITDILKHYRSVFLAEIKKHSMNDDIGYAFEGPAYVPHPQAPGQLVVGWHMMLTLKHNILIGQPDIGVHIPVVGMTPPDDIIQTGARFLLDNAREERFKMGNAVGTEEGFAHGDVPRQADGSPVPPGLLPPGIGGQVALRRVQESPQGGGIPFKAKAVGKKVELPPKEEEEPTVTESDSGSFKIVDRRKRRK